jgi:hypothetical protein
VTARLPHSRTVLLFAVAFLLAVLAAAVVPDLAAAAADVRGAGRNVGETLKAWAGSIFGGGAAITACYFVLTRKVAAALAFTGLAMLVGGFVFAPEQMQQLSEGLWRLVLEGQ